MDTIAGATVFKTASSASRTRSVCEMAPPLGIAPSSHRLTGGPHTLCVERNALRGSAYRKPRSALCTASGEAIAPGRSCTCVVPLRRRMPVVCSATGASMKWSRASVLPRAFPDPKSGGFAGSLARGHDRVVLKWRPVRALLPRPSARQAAALHS